MKRHKRQHMSDGVRESIIARYLAGESAPKIAASLSFKESGVVKMLTRRGLVKPSPVSHRKHTFNENAFQDAENNPEVAYWVGFLMADGCVHCASGRSPVVRLIISARDRGHVCSFRDFLQSSHAIVDMPASARQNSRGGPMANFAVSSIRLADDLSRYGVTPRKSHSARVGGGLEFNRHFWRGMIDGDGNIGVYNSSYQRFRYASISLCGSLGVVGQFCDFLRFVSPGFRGSPRTSKSIWQTMTTGRYAINAIRLLYKDCHISLPRKLVKAQGLLRHCSPTGVFPD